MNRLSWTGDIFLYKCWFIILTMFKYIFNLSFFSLLVGCITKGNLQDFSEGAKPSVVSQDRAKKPIHSSFERNTSLKEGCARIAIRVGKDVITNIDIQERCKMIAFFSHKENDARFVDNIRPQVKQKLVDEVIYEQIAAQSKMDVEKEVVQAYIRDYAERYGLSCVKFEELLKKTGIFNTFINLIRSRVIGSYIFMSAIQKDLLRISEKQIEDEIIKMKKDEKKIQYSLFEIVFYSKGNLSAQDTASKTYQELVKLKEKMPPIKAFQSLAQQLSQASTAQEGGYRGWVVEGSMDYASEAAIKKLSIGDFTKPIQIRPGEYRIFYLNDLKKPGYAPYSETQVDLCVVSIPFCNNLSQEEQLVIQRRIEALMECTSEKEFQGVAEDFEYSFKRITKKLEELPTNVLDIKLNVCLRPIFTGKSLEIYMPLRQTAKKIELSIDRESISRSLEYQRKSLYAEKVIKDFKNRVLIQDYDAL